MIEVGSLVRFREGSGPAAANRGIVFLVDEITNDNTVPGWSRPVAWLTVADTPDLTRSGYLADLEEV